MTGPQVLIDPRGAREEELAAAVATLLLQVPAVEVVAPGDDELAGLVAGFGHRVHAAEAIHPGRPVLVTPGRVCWAVGGVRRVLAPLGTPGRSLTRVHLAGLGPDERVACWSPAWLAGCDGTPEDLVAADLAFDREHLPHGSPVARSWVRGIDVGLAVAGSVGRDPERWARREGARLGGQELVASVRAPLGSLRRRVRRHQQRRAVSQRSA